MDDLVKRLRGWPPSIAHNVMRDAADRIEELEAKLATCEKYRDAYAECDRIGTQAVRDLEAKLAKAVDAFDCWRSMMENPAYDLGEMVYEFDAIVSTNLKELTGGKDD